MPRALSAKEWAEFETIVRAFCELRSEYRRRKADGSLGEALDERMRQSLNVLDLRIERMKCGNELALERARYAEAAAGDDDTSRRIAK